MSKASALGLQFDAKVQAQYALPLNAKYALDTLHTSWSILCGFPRKRSISQTAAIANSVVVRYQHDNTYRPSNLTFSNGGLSVTYDVVGVVGQPAQ